MEYSILKKLSSLQIEIFHINQFDLNKIDYFKNLIDNINNILQKYNAYIYRTNSNQIISFWGYEVSEDDIVGKAVLTAYEIHNIIESFNESNKDLDNLDYLIWIDYSNIFTNKEYFLGNYYDDFNRLINSVEYNRIYVSRVVFDLVNKKFDFIQYGEFFYLDKITLFTKYQNKWGYFNDNKLFVGRDYELNFLKSSFNSCIEDNQKFIVAISGDEGIGKSHLIYEFEKWLDCLDLEIKFFKTCGEKDKKNSPYYLLKQIISIRAGINKSDSIKIVWKKLRENIPDEISDISIELIGHLVGYDFSEKKIVKQLIGTSKFKINAFNALKKYFVHMSNYPSILIVDDIQWADKESINLLMALNNEFVSSKLLVILLGRENFDLPKYKFLIDHHINLSGLDNESVKKLLYNKINIKKDSKIDSIIIKNTQGNPYYIEEVLNTLKNQMKNGKINILNKIPNSLIDILNKRINDKSDKEKELLDVAAVSGNVFWHGFFYYLFEKKLLENIVNKFEIKEILNQLQNDGIISKRTNTSIINNIEFYFNSDKMHQLVYKKIPQDKKRLYHLNFANWIEKETKDRANEYYLVLADHYKKAKNIKKAGYYYAYIGKNYLEKSEYIYAINYFFDSLELLGSLEYDEEFKIEIYYYIAKCSYHLGKYIDTRKYIDRIQKLSKNEENYYVVKANILNGLVNLKKGNYEIANTILVKNLEISKETFYIDCVFDALIALADYSFRIVDIQKSFIYSDEAIFIALKLNNNQLLGMAYRVKGFAFQLAKQYQKSIETQKNGLTCFEKVGDKWGICSCYINIGEAYKKMELYIEAIENYNQAQELAEENDIKLSYTICLLNKAFCQIKLDNINDAKLNLDNSLEISLEIQAIPAALEILVYYSYLFGRNNDFQKIGIIIGFVKNNPHFNNEINYFIQDLFKTIDVNQLELKQDMEMGKDFTFDEIKEIILTF